MERKKLLSLSFFGIVMLSMISCSQNDVEQTLETSSEKVSIEATLLSHVLSIDSIKSIALSLPNVFGNVQTKNVEKTIKEVLPLSHFIQNAPQTKSTEETIDCIYVVNYEANNGFSILSRDTRVPTVLGYSDNGNIVPGDIHDGLAYVLDIIPGYVSQKMDEYNQRMDSLNQHLSSFLIQTKAFGDCQYDSLALDKELEDLEDSNNKILETFYYYEGDWTTVTQYGPLYNGIDWHQGYPFYNSIDGKDGCDHCLVGCVAVAVAHILAYNQYPTSFTAKGVSYTVDWSSMTKYTSSTFVRGVADAVDTDYGCNGSGSTISKAENTLENIFGYQTDGETSYNWSDIYTDVRNGQIVYTRGEDSSEGGHAWVIDGIFSRKRFRHEVATIYNRSDNSIVGTQCIGESDYTQNLVHCRWGWSNCQGNGYFETGLFNVTTPVISDGVSTSSSYYYNQSQKIIKNVHK
ncbi:MAG: C10 family peptidase [Parabacteroides sp.]|nr:C10 family peptidase [Parabacteroides sp.]